MVDEANDRDLNSGFLLTDLAGTHIDKWTSAQVLKTLHCLAYWTVNSDDGGCNCARSHLSINECASSLLKGKWGGEGWTRPHMPRLRNWSRQYFLPMASSLHLLLCLCLSLVCLCSCLLFLCLCLCLPVCLSVWSNSARTGTYTLKVGHGTAREWTCHPPSRAESEKAKYLDLHSRSCLSGQC